MGRDEFFTSHPEEELIAKFSVEESRRHSREECQQMQLDVSSGRARIALLELLVALERATDSRIRQAGEVLKRWDCVVDSGSPAAAMFNVFFTRWCQLVAGERFPKETAGFVSANIGGLALRLLQDDDLGWFQRQSREAAIRGTLTAALDELATRLGPDMTTWQWGRLHILLQKHFLSSRGDLGQLLDRSGLHLSGDGNTVNSSTPDPSYAAWLGATYRMVADFDDSQQGLHWIEVSSVSGHPGSRHYDDQLKPWHEGKWHYTALAATTVDGPRLCLEPQMMP